MCACIVVWPGPPLSQRHGIGPFPQCSSSPADSEVELDRLRPGAIRRNFANILEAPGRWGPFAGSPHILSFGMVGESALPRFVGAWVPRIRAQLYSTDAAMPSTDTAWLTGMLDWPTLEGFQRCKQAFHFAGSGGVYHVLCNGRWGACLIQQPVVDISLFGSDHTKTALFVRSLAVLWCCGQDIHDCARWPRQQENFLFFHCTGSGPGLQGKEPFTVLCTVRCYYVRALPFLRLLGPAGAWTR